MGNFIFVSFLKCMPDVFKSVIDLMRKERGLEPLYPLESNFLQRSSKTHSGNSLTAAQILQQCNCCALFKKYTEGETLTSEDKLSAHTCCHTGVFGFNVSTDVTNACADITTNLFLRERATYDQTVHATSSLMELSDVENSISGKGGHC